MHTLEIEPQPRPFLPFVLRRAFGVVLVISLGCGDEGSDAASGADTSSGGMVQLGTGGQSSSGAGGSTANAGGSASASGGTSGSTGGAPSSGGSDGGSPSSGGSGETPTGGASTGGVSSGSGGNATGGTAAVVAGIFVPDPSWACGMPEGLVDPELGELVFSATLEIGAVRDVGGTQYGDRRFTDIKGGTTQGDLSASFLEGGLDFELTLENGTTELEQVAMLQADDGSYIYMRSCGIGPAGSDVVRFVPDFEVATTSSLAWLNTGTFMGKRTLDSAKNQMDLAIYDVSAASGDGPEVTWQDPAGVPQQPWDCLELSGGKGAEVFTETVGIGSSLSVGASKRGTRNVIPITGGSVSGRFTGSVVPAGADYQLLGGTATLDARYVLESNDGEFVLVRNCGPFGGMVPLFEARDDGPYAFLNENQFLSSDPGSAAGGVSITFYELQ